MDIISAEKILKTVKNPSFYNIKVFDETVSTSTLLKELAKNGAPEGTVVIAERQTGGRGRLGRSFFSPFGTGIYMSFLVRPQITLADSAKITALAAVSVCEAIKDVTGIATGIKWVNDVYKAGKKISGILTEAVLSDDNISPKFISVGIGINVYQSDMPKEIADIATSLFTENPKEIRNELIARILDIFYGYYTSEIAVSSEKKSFVEKYREYSVVTGKQIKVIRGFESFEATAIGIGEDCSLLVRLANGDTLYLSSGEITIRPLDGKGFGFEKN